MHKISAILVCTKRSHKITLLDKRKKWIESAFSYALQSKPAYKPSNVFKMYRTTSFILQQDFAKKQQILHAFKNKQYSET